MMKTADRSGFMLLELIIALTIIGVIASIAIPHFVYSAKEARAAACTGNRDAMRKAMLLYMDKEEIQPGSPLPHISDIVGTGILTEAPACPSGGDYIWIDELVPEEKVPMVGCSVHYWPSLAAKEEASQEVSLLSTSFADMTGLQEHKGSWSARGGSLVPTGGKNSKSSNMISFGTSDWGDVTLNLTATNEKKTGYNLYYRGSLNQKENNFQTGYVLQYDPGNGKFTVKPIESGKTKKAIASYKMPKSFPKSNQPHDISISAAGQSHTVSINGQVIMSFDDARYSSGIAGVSSGKGSNSFSNLDVSEYGS